MNSMISRMQTSCKDAHCPLSNQTTAKTNVHPSEKHLISLTYKDEKKTLQRLSHQS